MSTEQIIVGLFADPETADFDIAEIEESRAYVAALRDGRVCERCDHYPLTEQNLIPDPHWQGTCDVVLCTACFKDWLMDSNTYQEQTA